jgi:hypothetical protein
VGKKKLDIEDESLPFVIGTGSYGGFTPTPKDEKRKNVQIGFVRQKPKRQNNIPKTSKSKSPLTTKRKK